MAKTKQKAPKGKKIVTISLAPRRVTRDSGATLRLGPAMTPGAAQAAQPMSFAQLSDASEDAIHYITAGETHQGTREYQQDAYYVSNSASARRGDSTGVFGILCDGMGGMERGGEASSIVVDELSKELGALAQETEIAEFFKENIRKMDRMLAGRFGDGVTGTTLVAAVVVEDRLYWCSVGDSRVYLLRAGEIVQVTRDHNYHLQLMEKADAGEITVVEADTHPDREALISFIGSGRADLIDANSEPFHLENGDVILLCSDGLNKSLSDAEIGKLVFNSPGSLVDIARQLIRTSIDIDMNAKDNTTVVLIRYVSN
ncbi:MAG: protein phosphatase 2C domain-containing protein [Oscillospiraceae bacterium]|nr:protein phosphatase 2C domain-containing protein [Oscillospiraceae bacterium]